VDDISGIDETETYPAGDRRRDPGIDDLELGVIDVGRILLDIAFVLADQINLRIQLLFGNCILSHEVPVAFQIEPGVVEERLIAGERALRQLELHLVRANIDLRKHLIFLDQIAFLEVHLHELPSTRDRTSTV